MSQQSISERFIDTMAEIRALDRLTGNDEPMRHVVRTIKQVAERTISEALDQAAALAYTARQLPKESRDIVAEAIEKALNKEPTV